MDTRNLTQNVFLTCTRIELNDDARIPLSLPALCGHLRHWPHRIDMFLAELALHMPSQSVLRESPIGCEYRTEYPRCLSPALLGMVFELFQSGQCVLADNEIDGPLHSLVRQKHDCMREDRANRPAGAT